MARQATLPNGQPRPEVKILSNEADIIYRGGWVPISSLWRLKPDEAFERVSLTEPSTRKRRWKWPWRR